jgi:hypothetical protein
MHANSVYMPQFREFLPFNGAGVEVTDYGAALRAPRIEGGVFDDHIDTPSVDLGHRESKKHGLPLAKSRIGRAVFAVAMAGAAFLAAEAVPQTPGHEEAALLYELGRADAAYYFSNYQPPTSVSTLNNDFGVGNGLYRASSIPLSGYAQLWWASRADEADYVASLIPGPDQSSDGRAFRNTLEALTETSLAPQADGRSAYDPTPSAFNQIVSPFVDDGLWMADLEMHSGDPAKVGVVSDIFDVALSQWDENGGGDFWEVQTPDAINHIRAIVSNATAVRVGAWLYEQTGNPYYLEKSEQVLNWIQHTLCAGNGYLYYDHIDRDGEVNTQIYTYTLMDVAVAKAALSQADPEKYPLQDAVDQIEKDMAYIQEHKLWGNPSFDSIWGLGGLWVASLYKNPEFTAKVLASITEAVSAAPKHPTNLLDFAGSLTLSELLNVPKDQYSKLF